MTRILLTGGGTAGHVTPNIALIPYLREKGFDIEYMGSYEGIEKKLIEAEGIPYTGIDSGKLRRYLSLQNLKDPAHIIHGFSEAKAYMKENRPDVVFSKGGFVAVPVIFAAHELKIPVVIHESDLTPGLANKLCIPKADKICYNFPETESYLKGKGIHTGLPIRKQLLEGSAERGLAACGFTGDKPVLMVIGGSLGSQNVNKLVRDSLPDLLKRYNILHLCGRGNVDETLIGTPGYKQFAYVTDDLKDYFALADVVVSRAGANAICEILALHKPNILIPLGTAGSRGDQLLNAKSFAHQGFSEVLLEEDATPQKLIALIDEIYADRADWAFRMEASQLDTGVSNIIHLIKKLSGMKKTN